MGNRPRPCLLNISKMDRTDFNYNKLTENIDEIVQNRKQLYDILPHEPSWDHEEFVKVIRDYRMAGIDIEILERTVDGYPEKVKIKQSRLVNGYLLNQQELVERAKSVFRLLGHGDIKVVAVVHSFDADGVTIEWIQERMGQFGIHRKDLIKQLAIDKSYISKLFSGDINLSRPMRALFHYYFMTYELNRDLRQQIA